MKLSSSLKKLILSVLLLAGILYSQDFDLLSMTHGAATAALSGAGSSKRANLEGLFQNPAGLAALKNIYLSVSYNPILEMNSWSASGAIGFEKGLTLAAGIIGLSYGDINGDIQFNGDVGKKYSPEDMALAFGLGLPILPKNTGVVHLDLGLNALYAKQTIDTKERSDFFLGSGFILAFQFNAHNELSLSGGIRNLGIKKISEGPNSLYFGTSYFINYSALQIRALADGNLQGGQFALSTGLELGLLQTFSFRAGYQLGNNSKQFSFGVGTKLHFGIFVPQLDYAYTPYGDLGAEHKIQLTFSFDSKQENKPDIKPTPAPMVKESPAPKIVKEEKREATATPTPVTSPITNQTVSIETNLPTEKAVEKMIEPPVLESKIVTNTDTAITNVLPKAAETNQTDIDTSSTSIQEAKALVEQKEYVKALDLLEKIKPTAGAYAEATELIKWIKAKMAEFNNGQ